MQGYRQAAAQAPCAYHVHPENAGVLSEGRMLAALKCDIASSSLNFRVADDDFHSSEVFAFRPSIGADSRAVKGSSGTLLSRRTNPRTLPQLREPWPE